MEISKSLILQIAQLNDEISILEDKILADAREFLNENVIWTKEGKRGKSRETQTFSELISRIIDMRNDRYYDCPGFLNMLYKRDEELWKEFNRYLESLSVRYDLEEVRDGGDDNSFIKEFENPLKSLDYWTSDR